MLFGVEQRGEVVDEITEYLQEAYAEESVDLSSIRKSASDAIKKSQSYNMKYFNEHHKPAESFQIGDYVVLKNVDTTAGLNKKLIPKYRGPYIIQKELGNDRYEISDVEENCQITQMPYCGIVDSSRLKKWLEHKDNISDIVSDSEGNTYEDYQYLEDECNSSETIEYQDYEYLDD